MKESIIFTSRDVIVVIDGTHLADTVGITLRIMLIPRRCLSWSTIT